MSFYELTIRFEAGGDAEALDFAVDVEKTVKAEDVLTPLSWVQQKCVIGKLTRVIVTQMDDGG